MTQPVAPTPTDEKAPASAAPAAKEKEAPEEKPFTVDVLKNCTSRYTRKAWDLFLEYEKDLNLIQTAPVRSTLTARSAQAAGELAKILQTEGNVTQLTVIDEKIHFTAPFSAVQLVIKHPETQWFDASKA